MVGAMTNAYRAGGVRSLFAGIAPRVMWIGLGGGIFFGCYERAKKFLTGRLNIDEE